MVDEDELKCERVGRGDGEYKVCAAKVFIGYSAVFSEYAYFCYCVAACVYTTLVAWI